MELPEVLNEKVILKTVSMIWKKTINSGTCLFGLLWRGAVVLTESALETLFVIFVGSQKSVAW